MTNETIDFSKKDMENKYTMRAILPYTSGADAITTHYKSIDDIIKFFSICWSGLYEQLIKQKDEEVIFLEYDNVLYYSSPRFIIVKNK